MLLSITDVARGVIRGVARIVETRDEGVEDGAAWIVTRDGERNAWIHMTWSGPCMEHVVCINRASRFGRSGRCCDRRRRGRQPETW